MKTIHTSYYRNAALDNGQVLVSISRTIPSWINAQAYSVLAPSWELLRAYTRHDITEKEYVKIYSKEVLERLDPMTVYKDLSDNSVLLCWESPEKFCHRHLVARWLTRYTPANVTEL